MSARITLENQVHARPGRVMGKTGRVYGRNRLQPSFFGKKKARAQIGF
jgi:hypothetical protein